MKTASTIRALALLSCLCTFVLSCDKDGALPESTLVVALGAISGAAHRNAAGTTTAYLASATLTVDGTAYYPNTDGAIQFPTPSSGASAQLAVTSILDLKSGSSYLPDSFCPAFWTQGAACTFGGGTLLVAMTQGLPSTFTDGSNDVVSFQASTITNGIGGTLPLGTSLSGILIGVERGTAILPAYTITELFLNTGTQTIDITVATTGDGTPNLSTTALKVNSGGTPILAQTILTALAGTTNQDGSLTVSVPADISLVSTNGLTAVLIENAVQGSSPFEAPQTTFTGTAALAVGCSVSCACRTLGEYNGTTVSCSATGKNASCAAVPLVPTIPQSACSGVKCTDDGGTVTTSCPGA